MRNRLYLLVTLILSCLCSYNLDAKVIDYLGHQYDGIVVNKAPQGYGTMIFDGFTIEGTFNGNEVTDAHITVGDFEVGYEGTLTYNESQKVILKAGGTLTADVYEYTDITSDHMVIGVVTKFPLRKETKTIEKVLEDKVVGADYFNVDKFTWYLPIDLTEKSIVPKELNPSVLMRPITVTEKIRIRYPEEALESDGTIPIWKPWKEDDKAAIEYEVSENLKGARKESSYGSVEYWMKCRNPKTKTIFVCDFKYNERTRTHNVANKKGNAYGDKDEQGRIWYCDESNYYVQCLNGDFYSYAGGGQVECKATLPNNVIITYNSRQRDVKYTVLDENKKEIATLVQPVNNDVITKLFASACAGKTDFLPKLDLSKCKARMFNETSLTPELICNLLKNEIFPRFDIEKDEEGGYKCTMVKNIAHQFPKSMQDYGRLIEVYLTNGYYCDGVYFVDKDQYYSTKEIYNLKSAEEEAEREKANAEKEAYIASRVAPLKKAFGVNPFDYNLGKVLKAGASFKDLQKYFELSVEAYNKSWGITDRYYYFSLYQDHGSSKCYEFGYGKWLSSGNELGHVWVTNGKVSSVTWY